MCAFNCLHFDYYGSLAGNSSTDATIATDVSVFDINSTRSTGLMVGLIVAGIIILMLLVVLIILWLWMRYTTIIMIWLIAHAVFVYYCI